MKASERHITIVTPAAKTAKIEQVSPNTWRVSVTESAHADAANFAVQKMLARELHRPANHLILKNGRKNKTKMWELK